MVVHLAVRKVQKKVAWLGGWMGDQLVAMMVDWKAVQTAARKDEKQVE